MTNIIDIPSEVIQINEAANKVIDYTGKEMCVRLDAKAEAARQIYLRTGEVKDLYAWAGFARQADSARITYKEWRKA